GHGNASSPTDQGISKSNVFDSEAVTVTSRLELMLYSGGIRSGGDGPLGPGNPPTSSDGCCGAEVMLTRYLPGTRPCRRGMEYLPPVIGAPDFVTTSDSPVWSGKNSMEPVSSGAPWNETSPEIS